jgi:hypothetical protein
MKVWMVVQESLEGGRVVYQGFVGLAATAEVAKALAAEDYDSHTSLEQAEWVKEEDWAGVVRWIRSAKGATRGTITRYVVSEQTVYEAIE